MALSNAILYQYFNLGTQWKSLHTVKSLQVLLCITNNSIKHQSFVYTQLKVKTVLFLIIQFSVSPLLDHSLNVSSIWNIDRSLSGAATLGQVNQGAMTQGELHIPQKLYDWTLTIKGFCVISKTPIKGGALTPLQRCSRILLGCSKTWF